MKTSMLIAGLFMLSQLTPVGILQAQANESEADESFNFNDLSLSDFGGALTEGSFNVDPELVDGLSLSRSWEKGEQIENILNVGDLESLGAQDFTLSQISELSGVNLDALTVGDVPLLGKNTQLLESLGGEDLSKIQETVLSKIPELENLPIKDLAGWQDELISKIPGLADLPLGVLSGFPNKIPVAKLDVAFQKAETQSTHHVISGSDKNKYSDPCKQEKCAYTELGDILGKGSLTGARWIVGGWSKDEGEQLTEGGSGVLGKLFGGKEPTGRPLGKDFKLILTDTDETTGTASYGISFRFCKFLKGCTPYMFGPFPLGLQASEGGLVFLGFESKKVQGKDLGLEIPKDALDKANKALIAKGIKGTIDQFGGAISNSGKGGEKAFKNSCDRKILSKSGGNSSIISEVLKIGKDRKFTEGQAAYLLAYSLETGAKFSDKSLFGHRRTIEASQSDLNSLSSNNGRYEGLQPEAAKKWKEMKAAAADDGIDLKIGDTFRTISDQEKLFSDAVKREGSADKAAKTSAPPHFSEHHTGYAIDIRGSNGLLTQDKDPDRYAWLVSNASRFGFEQSFDGSGSIAREDWHWRFIGSENALTMLGFSEGASVDSAIDTITQYVDKNKADFFGAGRALRLNDSQAIAHKAADYQAILKDCFYAGGGGCDGNFVNPHPGGYFTSPFGMRLSPTTGVWKLHAGVDMSSGGGTVLLAPCGGQVLTRWESGYGNVVLINTGQMTIRIAHLSQALVSTGAQVSKGQPVGVEGNTGAGTGPHSHTETRVGGPWGEPQNPENFINFGG